VGRRAAAARVEVGLPPLPRAAVSGEDTTSVGTAPRRRSMRPLRPCLTARSRREPCGREPTRMMGSLLGGEGSLLSSCSLLMALLLAVAAVVHGRRTISIRRARRRGHTMMMSRMESSVAAKVLMLVAAAGAPAATLEP